MLEEAVAPGVSLFPECAFHVDQAWFDRTGKG